MHRQFNLVWNKLFFIFAFAIVEMMRAAVEECGRENKKMKRETQNRYYWRGKITGMWTIFVCSCYLHFVHVRTTKHYFGLVSSEREIHALNTRTNLNKQRKHSLNNALSLRSTCRFLRWDSITSEEFSFGRAHALLDFPNFPASMSLACLLLFVCCCCVREYKSIKNYVRFCRSNVCQNVYRETDSILLSFFFHCLWIIESPRRICYNFLFVILLSRRPTVSAWADSVKFNRLQFWSY